ARQQFPQEGFALREGPFPQVAAIQPEQIERIKTEWSAPPHQLIEHRPTIRPGMHNFAVQDGRPASELLGNGLRERFKCLKRIPVARYQPAGAALDISESSKTVHFRLEDPRSRQITPSHLKFVTVINRTW